MKLQALLKRLGKRKPLEFADSKQTDAHRAEVDAFLHRVLPEDEREFIETFFITDDATIFDCSMAMPEDWIRNCESAYGMRLSLEDLRMPLHRLVRFVAEHKS